MREHFVLNLINDVNITSTVPAPSPARVKPPKNKTLAATKEGAMLQDQGPNTTGLVRMLCKPVAARAAPDAWPDWKDISGDSSNKCNNSDVKRAGWIAFAVFSAVAAVYLLWVLWSTCWSRNARVVPGS